MSDQLSKDFNGNTNKAGIPKDRLKALIEEFGLTPGINMALFIASGALGKKKTWMESDYGEHWLRVSAVHLGDMVSETEKIVGILHDVLEDSDWDIADLEKVGFSHHVCEGVQSVTKNEGEKYLDAVKRASINRFGRRVKMRDNRDNMDLTRSRKVPTEKQKFLYPISFAYLQAVDEERIPANISIWKFLRDDKFSGLITAENIAAIAMATEEPVPEDFRKEFNYRVEQPQPVA